MTRKHSQLEVLTCQPITCHHTFLTYIQMVYIYKCSLSFGHFILHVTVTWPILQIHNHNGWILSAQTQSTCLGDGYSFLFLLYNPFLFSEWMWGSIKVLAGRQQSSVVLCSGSVWWPAAHEYYPLYPHHP